jgi:hypothetical protein
MVTARSLIITHPAVASPQRRPATGGARGRFGGRRRHRQLVTGHIRWFAAVAAHRGTAEVLPDVLDAFRSELHDFPFAQACLAEGHALLVRQEGM